MTNSEPHREPVTPAPQRRRRRWAVRILILLLALVLAVVLAVALLPWWLPRRWVKQRIAAEMAQALDRPTTVGDFRLGWRSGIEVLDISVTQQPPFGPGPFLTIDRVHLPMTPRAFLKKTVPQLTIAGLDLYCIVDSDGDLNLADLLNRPPSDSDFHIEQIELSDIIIHLAHSTEDLDQSLTIRNAMLSTAADTQVTRWSLEAYQDQAAEATITSQGTIGGWDQGRAGPTVNVTINSLDLGALQLAAWLNSLRPTPTPQDSGLRLTELTGILSGQVELSLDAAAGVMAGQLDLSAVNLSVAPPQSASFADSAVIPATSTGELLRNFGVSLDFSGAYDPQSRAWHIDDLHWRGDGLTGAVLGLYQPADDTKPARLWAELQETSIDLAALAQAAPALMPWLDKWAALSTAEPTLALTATLDSTPQADSFSLGLTAPPTAEPNPEIEVRFRLHLDRPARRLTLEAPRLRWLQNLDGTLQLTAALPSAAPPLADLAAYQQWWQAALADLRETLDFTCTGEFTLDDVPGLLAALPTGAALPPTVNMSGPVAANWAYHGPRAPTSFELTLPPTTTLTLANPTMPGQPAIFAKQPATALTISLQALPTTARSLEQLSLHVAHGPADFRLDAATLVLSDDWQPTAFTGPWQITGLEHWQAASPSLAEHLTAAAAAITGDLNGSLTFKDSPRSRELAATLNLAALGITVKSPPAATDLPAGAMLLDKARGQELSVNASFKETYHTSVITYELQATEPTTTLEVAGTMAPVTPTWTDGPLPGAHRHHITLRADTGDLARLKQISPALLMSGWIIPDDITVATLSGPADFHGALEALTLLGRPVRADLQGQANAAGAAIRLESVTEENPEPVLLWNKPPQTPGAASFNISAALAPTWRDLLFRPLHLPLRVTIRQLDAELADLALAATGALVFDIPYWSARAGDVELRRTDLSLTGDYDHDRTQGQFPEWLAALAGPALKGHATFAAEGAFDRLADEFAGNLRLDMTGAALETPLNQPTDDGQTLWLRKPPAETLTINAAWTTTARAPQRINIQPFNLRMPGLAADASVLVDLAQNVAADTAWAERLAGAQVDLQADCTDLAAATRWLSPALLTGLRGNANLKARIDVAPPPDQRFHLHDAVLGGDIGFDLLGFPWQTRIDQVRVADNRLVVSALGLRVAENDLNLVCDLSLPSVWPRGFADLWPLPEVAPGQPTQRFEILSERLDLDFVARLLREIAPTPAGGATPGEMAAGDPLTLPRFLAAARALDLQGAVRINRLNFTDPKTRIRLGMDSFSDEFRLRQGLLRSSFRTAMFGGVIDGSLDANFNLADPNFVLRYGLAELRAGEALAPLIEYEFPGLQVLGALTEERYLHTTLSRLLYVREPWLGWGVNVFTDGILSGPGGPGWIIRAFPGLDLVRYRWQRMTNRFELLPGGQKRNEMIFSGNTYDIYIRGTSTTVRDEGTRNQALSTLQRDLTAAQEMVQRLMNNPQSLDFQFYQRRRQELAELQEREQASSDLPIARANYEVGVIITRGTSPLPLPGRLGEVLQLPKTLLRVPVFHTQGFVVGPHMVGIQTTSQEP